ncbi:MAG: sugar phosphate isomerase/epimerase family protein [Bryobacteraceae bacterium]
MKSIPTLSTRRAFTAASIGLPFLFSRNAPAASKAKITVGITVDTRPDWNGPPNFIRSIDEASSVGYHRIETFWQYVERWQNNPQGLKDVLAARNLTLETVSNGGHMRTDFGDPGQRAGIVEDHMKLVNFIHKFGCDHLKINCGRRHDATGAARAKMYKDMSVTFEEIGKRMTDMGMKFGIHAHLGSNFQTREDIDAILGQTNPKYVYFVLDTGHITMAGMDPVELTRTYVSRIVEYHGKDCAPKDRGGYKGPPLQAGTYNTTGENRVFFELGKGGVDFPGIVKVLDSNAWSGWFTVELDRTATTSKNSCIISKHYLENVLKLTV